MKVIVKWIIIIITAIIFLYAYSSSYSSESLDHLDYVIAIGIDTMENSDNLQYSFEFANISSFSENASSEDSKPIINTVMAPTISSAINIMNSYVGKQIHLSHCKVIIFSEDVAKKGILPEVSALINNTQVRPTANILISEGKASEYIESSSSSLEKILTKYYDIFPTTSKYTGYTSNIILGELYDSIINEDTGATAILGRTVKSIQEESFASESSEGTNVSSSDKKSFESSQENSGEAQGEQNENGHDNPTDITTQNQAVIKGDRGTENIGLCVLKGDVDVGHLTAMETLCYSIIKDEVDSFLVSVDSPFDSTKKIDVSMDVLSSTEKDIDISQENPIINVKLNLTGEVLNNLDTLDYSDTQTLDKINSSLKEYLTSEMTNYLNKTSKELKVDINGFYKDIRKKFLTIDDYKNYNWSQKYENAKFNIEINSHIISSLLIQNS